MEQTKKESYGCWTCGQHFKTREELDEHFEDKRERKGLCPP